ncbi:MAG: AAA family ATPase [bacterium]|nr:AAA family ATPase [bacterium]
MVLTHIKIQNWKNFKAIETDLQNRTFLVGPNASGKSNFLDIFLFMQDIVKPGGGLQKALQNRGGLSKIRCLSAREKPGVELEFHFSNSFNEKTKWKYILAFKYEGKGRQRSLIMKEKVYENNEIILNRPNEEDIEDDWRLTETYLEQINSNVKFRDIYNFFNSMSYQHLVPQLLRNPNLFFNTTLSEQEDSYGFYLLERIVRTPSATRKSRLKKIEEALKIAVPQFKELKDVRDERGIPHLEITYEHWRPNAGKQQEDQFSDGTLRLIGFLWSLFEKNSLLLLEEPELSLHPKIVKQIPSLIYRISKSKKKKQQLFISTHSPDSLDDKGIGGEEVLLFIPDREGTKVLKASANREIHKLLESGFTPADAILPYTEPLNIEQLGLFE